MESVIHLSCVLAKVLGVNSGITVETKAYIAITIAHSLIKIPFVFQIEVYYNHLRQVENGVFCVLCYSKVRKGRRKNKRNSVSFCVLALFYDKIPDSGMFVG